MQALYKLNLPFALASPASADIAAKRTLVGHWCDLAQADQVWRMLTKLATAESHQKTWLMWPRETH